MARFTTATLSAAAAAAAALFTSHASAASYNGLAVTPQMGWDNWNAFGCKVDEKLLLGTAQKIVDYGYDINFPALAAQSPHTDRDAPSRLRDLGYHYVILDDCWSTGRTANGTLQANTTKFPNGMKYVGDQLHQMGLGFGMYSSAGYYTCAQYAASLGKESQDAKTFASWGVDYLKYDNCYNAGQEGNAQITYSRYKVMSDALNATGRPILYSLCNWGTDYPWNWAQTMANSWRISGDVYDSFDRPDSRCPCTTWDCNLPGYHCSVMNILNKVAPFANKGQPGAWNDLDMLEVGNSGMTDDEYKLHITMWALVKSPLIMGNDITLMTPSTLSLLSNPALLAISQDPLGSSAFRVWQRPGPSQNNTPSTVLYSAGETSFWTGQLSAGDYVAAFVNAGTQPATLQASMSDIFIDQITTGSSAPVTELAHTWDVYDIWANRMDNATASAIINGTAAAVAAASNSTTTMTNATLSSMLYNTTTTSYAAGLAKNMTALLGAKTATLAPGGSLTATVPAHGVAAFRLRSQGAVAMRRRDEL